MSTKAAAHGPLSDLRVLEIGHFVAAPFCTRLLADLGADVIKIEPPAGDPVRQWGKQVDGHSAWWSLHGRNKRSITLNLKHPKAIDIVLRLSAHAMCSWKIFARASWPGALPGGRVRDALLARPNACVAVS
jgi:crotonobetainyl-CoA:carnitine CoA-transferase CaiB-like acyl-CoA transferase